MKNRCKAMICGLILFAGQLFSADPSIAAARAAQEEVPRLISFDVAPQPLDEALSAVAQQADIALAFYSDLGRGLNAPGLTGRFTAQRAFNQLLLNTPLRADFIDARNVVIRAASDASQVAADAGGLGVMRVSSASAGADEVGRSDSPSRFSEPEATSQTVQAGSPAPDSLDQVVVTGTIIRGLQNPTSPLIVFDRGSIDRSGYQTIQDFIQSIPENFGGGAQGASPDGNLGPGSNSHNNNEHGTAVNLRGLGESATLVLLNGHRMAPSAFGQIVDISTIPLASVDHIDVLTDGASAIYGADAVAGVVNIVLRDNCNCAESRASYGGVTSGPMRTAVYDQTLGHNWSSGAFLGTLEYSHQNALPSTDRESTAEATPVTNIINPSTQLSFITNGHQTAGDRLEVSMDSLVTWRHTHNIYNLGGQDDAYSDPHSQNYHLGISYQVFHDWILDLSGTYSRQSTPIGFLANPDPTLPLGHHSTYYTARNWESDLNVNGKLFLVPGGEVKLAVGGSKRSEKARSIVYAYGLDNSTARDVTAEFAELYIPVVSSLNRSPLLERLTISAAVRRDDYSDFGSTTNPKIGIRWSPIDSLDLRATWSKSFRPPNTGELLFSVTNGQTLYNYTLTNPNGGPDVPAFFTGGTDPHLGPEKARNINIGLDFRPTFIDGLTISVSYYDILFKNRIITPPFDAEALLKPNVYGSLISPFANDAAASAYLANFIASGGVYSEFLGTGATGVRYLVDNQVSNAAVVRQNGADLNVAYRFLASAEKFRIGGNFAFINKIDTQFAPNTTATNLVNTYSSPLRIRVRGDATWTHGPLDLTAALNYSNAYTDTSVSPYAPISSWTTLDASARFRLSELWQHTAALEGLEVQISLLNTFDRAPPFVSGLGITGIHYDVGNASPVGRSVYLGLKKLF